MVMLTGWLLAGAGVIEPGKVGDKVAAGVSEAGGVGENTGAAVAVKLAVGLCRTVSVAAGTAEPAWGEPCAPGVLACAGSAPGVSTPGVNAAGLQAASIIAIKQIEMVRRRSIFVILFGGCEIDSGGNSSSKSGNGSMIPTITKSHSPVNGLVYNL
jgi:hypothetical protein